MTNDDGGLRPLFKRHLPQVDWCPIENLWGGVPDTNACYKGKEWWIEFKATTTHDVRFRPLQPGWIHRRTRAGGRVWMAVRYRPPAFVGADCLVLVPGAQVLTLATQGLASAASGATSQWYAGGPTAWPWEEILNFLMD